MATQATLSNQKQIHVTFKVTIAMSTLKEESFFFFNEFAPLKARGATTRRGATRKKEEIQ